VTDPRGSGDLPAGHPYNGQVNEESYCVSCRTGTAPPGEKECDFCRIIDPDVEDPRP